MGRKEKASLIRFSFCTHPKSEHAQRKIDHEDTPYYLGTDKPRFIKKRYNTTSLMRRADMYKLDTSKYCGPYGQYYEEKKKRNAKR